MVRIELPDHDVVGIRADNPSPFSLDGTNSWMIGREPTWLIDPGPALDEHLDAISDEIDARGGLGAVLLTHDHHDHAEGVEEIVKRFSPVPLAAARGAATTVLLADGDRLGPLVVLAAPGHAADHLVFLTDDGVAFTGDAVVGQGSVFISGDLARYLAALAALRDRHLRVIAPGHGPLVTDPDAKLTEYIEHRLDREQRLLAALDRGLRTSDELLDDVWADAPAILRPAAEVTLAAHLEKLAEEGRLPEGVERPRGPLDWPEV
jgi:glyoxylase-like metal-dependent hydrolase (beta-lactamase superfamily II)